MARALPLNTTINKFTLKGFSTGDIPVPNGTDAITSYHGHPLYCHVDPDSSAGAGVTLTINEKPPNSFTTTSGRINSVRVTYQPSMSSGTQDFTWTIGSTDNPHYGGAGGATTVVPRLVFTIDLKQAELIIEQLIPKGTSNTIGIVVVGPTITGAAPEGYFVSVPMNQGGSDPTDYTGGGVSWGPGGAVSGPIGGLTVP
jgi:hypothetical protein